MSAAEEALKEKIKETYKPKTAPFLNRTLDFISSVRFGVVLLCVLVVLAMVGMLVIQQNVPGFDAYYASLTPAEKTVYGYLGIFNIYYSWYFNLVLVVLSLNIVLASIDHFPSSWSYIRQPKLSATRGWLSRQKQNTVLQIEGKNEREIAERIKKVFQANGLNAQITESKSSFYIEDAEGNKDYSKMESKTNLSVFGESGRINRLGAYVVHVALLTLFLGYFVAFQTGFDADVGLMTENNPAILSILERSNSRASQKTDTIELIQFNLDHQERYNVKLPFTITCIDIEQDLIDPKGSIEINNTLDWHTRVEIDDPEYGKTVADVSLNRPFSYRGYRFFQASAITVGSARNMVLEATPQTGGETVKINLARNGSANLPDGTKIDYEAFFPDFVLNGANPDTRSAEYNNPAVKLNITQPDGGTKSAYAFGRKMPDNIPVGAPVAGYKWRLAEFEKSPLAHVLSIKYDPFNAAFIAWYVGGFGLVGALCFVFFLSHKRVWALIEKIGEHNFEVVLGGDANRNAQGFEDKFGKISRQIIEPNQNIHSSES